MAADSCDKSPAAEQQDLSMSLESGSKMMANSLPSETLGNDPEVQSSGYRFRPPSTRLRPKSKPRAAPPLTNAVLEEERRSSVSRVKRLEEELSSLKEMYARKIANTELKCERLMQEKDDERDAWYKMKKQEIRHMKATVNIMHAFFEKKRQRVTAQMKADREAFDNDRAEFDRAQELAKAERRALIDHHAKEMANMTQQYETKVANLEAKQQTLEQQCRSLEEQLGQAQGNSKNLGEECERQRREIANLQKKLEEANQSQELLRRGSQIEALEAELRRTKKIMQEQADARAETLRKELMEYVKFIVHLLPDDGNGKKHLVGSDDWSTNLEEHLARGVKASMMGDGQARPLLPPVGGISGSAWRAGLVPSPPRTASTRPTTAQRRYG